MAYILSIDQGTSSTRALLFNQRGQRIGCEQSEITQYYPKDGWVEHDPEEIWQKTVKVIQQVLAKASLDASDITACGITNQRETTLLWDKESGDVLHNAIVWQDRRTADLCHQLSSHQAYIHETTGLIVDPYFSATKLQWLLKNVPEAKRLAAKGRLAFGTIDSYLIWRFSGGKRHVTDISNASRTMLFDINRCQWDPNLIELLDIPQQCLPEVLDCNAHFATIDKQYFGHAIPITGCAGDQQAASIGQACVDKGTLKSTYGTGCFLLLNTGEHAIRSSNQLLTTIAYRIDGRLAYGLEGSIFNAGTSIKWLRDNLGLLETASQSEILAASLEDNGGVYFVPAFTGLGAPYWSSQARGVIAGLTRDSTSTHIVRAALESVAYQTRDILTCMQKDAAETISNIRVDGGMVENNWLMQFLADICRVSVQRPDEVETTALGAAILAGLGAGVFSDLADSAKCWTHEQNFQAECSTSSAELLYQGWQSAVAQAIPSRNPAA